ncbi:MAG: class B sortase [Lachnospiraceae bacterium]|nr:class B sortase [Lachnospiraceae bacterium]
MYKFIRKKGSRPFLSAIICLISALAVTGCEGNSRDKNEAERGFKQEESFEAEAQNYVEAVPDIEEEAPEEEAPAEENVSEPEDNVVSDTAGQDGFTEALDQENTYEAEDVNEPEPPEVLDKYTELLQINPYVSGWLKVDDTVIDYPVVYTPGSQNYFLHRATDGSYSNTGSLFIAINWQEDNNNTLIYGHNMKDGSAFGTLLKFADEAYGRSHPVIHFDTLYEEDEYELYGAFYSQIDEEDLETEEDREQADKAIEESGIEKKAAEGEEVTAEELTLHDIDLHRDFGDEDIFRQEKDEDNGRFRYYYYTDLSEEDDFNYFAENVKERSLYDMGIEAEWGDRFVTLSTCSYQVKNGRFVVVGIKKKE